MAGSAAQERDCQEPQDKTYPYGDGGPNVGTTSFGIKPSWAFVFISESLRAEKARGV